jgi:exosortase
MDTASLIEPKEVSEPQLAAPPKEPNVPWWDAMVKSPIFIPACAVTAGLIFLFWHLISRLGRLWMDDSGYYSHGFLVPFIAGYIIVKKWDQLKDIPVKTGYGGIPALAFFAYLAYVTTHTNINAILSIAFLFCILSCIWFVAGWRWMLALSLPVLYLGFALPLWTGAIDFYTNPAQLASTTVAFQILKAIGLSPIQMKGEPTNIYLDHYTFNVAVPCSGLKLILAVTAFTSFFMMVAKLKWWGYAAMTALILPLCVFVNGLRIALIGLVGNTFGSTPEEHDAAAHLFHDWSGYLTLLVCFFLLFKIARGLGWKD